MKKLIRTIIIIINIVFVVTFILFMWLPLIDNKYDIAQAIKLVEKRELAAIPEIPKNKKEFEDFPKKFEDYYNDNFGFRNFLTLTHNKMRVNVLHEPSNPKKYLFGKDDWLFHAENLDYCHKVLDKKGVDFLYSLFYERKEWLKTYNIDYYLAIAPRKATIYPEYATNVIHPNEKYTILDQLVDINNKKQDPVNLVDLRKPLFEAKNNESNILMFFPCDTHWTEYGAYFAYKYLMEKMDITPLPLSRYDIKEIELLCTGDLKNLQGFGNDVKGITKEIKLKNTENDKIVEVKTLSDIVYESYSENTKLKNVFVIRDSFFSMFINSFAQHFAIAKYFKVYHKFIPEYITDQDYKINLCVHEVAEKYLSQDFQPNYPLVIENSITNLFERSTYKLIELNNAEIKNIIDKDIEKNKSYISFNKFNFDNSNKSIFKLQIESKIDSKMRIVEKNTNDAYIGIYENIRKGKNDYYLALPENFKKENFELEIFSSNDFNINNLEIRAREKKIDIVLIEEIRTGKTDRFHYSDNNREYSILRYKIDDKILKDINHKIKIYVRGQFAELGTIEIHNSSSLENMKLNGKFKDKYQTADLFYDIFYIDSPDNAKYIEVRFKGGNGWTNIFSVEAFLY